MDFSLVKEITIPEGAVSKIVNSSGAVLWEGIVTIEVIVDTVKTMVRFTVQKGSTWRDVAAIYNASANANNPFKIIIVEDMIMGDSVKIEYYYSGTRSETILDVKPDDFIDRTYYTTW